MVSLKKIFTNMSAFQYFTADRMSVVSPPSSNSWTPFNFVNFRKKLTFYNLTKLIFNLMFPNAQV